MQSERGLVGLSAGHDAKGFRPSHVFSDAVPRRFSAAGSSSLELPPLQSAATRRLLPITSGHLATTCRVESASHGVRMGPLRDVNQPEPPVAESAPAFRYGPSSAFLPPSTVCSPTGLAGLFHPAAAYRVPAPQGFVPPCGAAPGRPRPMPSCRFRLRLCGFPRQDADLRLQGLALRSESGGFGQRFKPSDAPCPSRACPPPGAPSPYHGSLRRLRPRP